MPDAAPVRWAGWEDGEGPLVRADRKEIARAGREWVSKVGYWALMVALLSTWVGRSDRVLSIGIYAALIAAVALVRLWFIARSRAADPEGVLSASGELAHVRIVHEGVVLGSDAGVLSLENGLLCFHGRRTTFSVPPKMVEAKRSRIVYFGPGGRYEARMAFPGTGGGRSLLPTAASGRAEPEAVAVLPPVTLGPGAGVETAALGAVALIGAALLAFGPGTAYHEVAMAVGGAILLPTLLFAAHVLRVRRSRR